MRPGVLQNRKSPVVATTRALLVSVVAMSDVRDFRADGRTMNLGNV